MIPIDKLASFVPERFFYRIIRVLETENIKYVEELRGTTREELRKFGRRRKEDGYHDCLGPKSTGHLMKAIDEMLNPPSYQLMLKSRLYEISNKIKDLKDEEQRMLKASLEAPDDQKVCQDWLADDLSDGFDPGFIFPLTVHNIVHETSEIKIGTPFLVRVRTFSPNETNIGMHIGELPTSTNLRYDPTTEFLKVSPALYNPAIIVPALGKIVMGYESFWERIKPEDIGTNKEITDKMIKNSWVARTFKELANAK